MLGHESSELEQDRRTHNTAVDAKDASPVGGARQDRLVATLLGCPGTARKAGWKPPVDLGNDSCVAHILYAPHI